MTDPIERYEELGFSEAYEVVRTVDVWVNLQHFRIEVLRCFSNPNTPYVVQYYKEETVEIQHTYPQTLGKFDRDVESVRIWKDIDVANVRMPDAEAALNQAIGFLSERFRQ